MADEGEIASRGGVGGNKLETGKEKVESRTKESLGESEGQQVVRQAASQVDLRPRVGPEARGCLPAKLFFIHFHFLPLLLTDTSQLSSSQANSQLHVSSPTSSLHHPKQSPLSYDVNPGKRSDRATTNTTSPNHQHRWYTRPLYSNFIASGLPPATCEP